MPTESTKSVLAKAPPGALVCVVDDDEAIRRSLGRLFSSVKLARETFASATEFLDRERPNVPWCLVLDVSMPGLDGLALQEALAERDTQIIFLTAHGNIPMCARALKAGAVDFLTKPVDAEELLAAVSKALARSAASLEAGNAKFAARKLLSTLTPKEFDVLRGVIAGLLNKQIAVELGSAEKTVKIHRGRVMAKMGVTSVAGLVRIAQAAGVTPATVAA